jgi:nitroreductase
VVAARAEGPPSDPPTAVAHAANLAPSGGNVQPWSLQLAPDRLRILLDRSRTSTMDVQHRGSYLAIGAALHNARVAAAARGILGPVAVLPDGGATDLVAELTFASGADPELAAAYAGVLARGTDRRAGTGGPVPPRTAAALREAAALAGARLHLITSADGLEDYAELLGESDRLRHLAPILHREMMGELRWPGRDRIDTGIDVRTLALDESDLAKLAVARRADVMSALASWDGGRALGSVTRDRIRSSSAVAVVTVTGTTPAAYVTGGQAVQRVWLAAEAAGLAVQPVSPICVFAVGTADFEGLVPHPYVRRLQALAARLRVVAALGEQEVVALVLRLSHTDGAGAGTGAVCRSMRLPLEEVLLGAPPAGRFRSGR